MFRVVLTGVACLGACLAQQPTFEAASVKVVDPSAPANFTNTGGPGTKDPGQIHWGHVPMIRLVMQAYGVQTDQVSAPAWVSDFLGPDQFAVDASMPPGTTKEQFQMMLQNLLAERFHLKVRHETRNFPGYELVVAKDGLKMKEVTPDPPAPADSPMPKPVIGKDGRRVLPPRPGIQQMIGMGVIKIEAHQRSIADLMRGLGATITQALGADMMDMGAPRARVTDDSGLTGVYDFTVEFACEGCRGLGAMAPRQPLLAGRAQSDAAPAAPSEPTGAGLPNIFVAFEKQLGLKLQKSKDVPLDVIVVEHVDKVPTVN